MFPHQQATLVHMPTPTLKSRWYHPTPNRLLVGLLIVEGLLWMAGQSDSCPKGLPVLSAIAAVGLTLLFLLLSLVVSVLFHWRFQFSLRSLLFAVFVAALPFSWLATEMKNAKRQAQVAKEIETLAGVTCWHITTVDFHYGEGSTCWSWTEETPPPWLTELLGDDFFFHVRTATIPYCGNETNLRYFDSLPKLWEATVCCPITDAGLEYVRGATRLQALHLYNRNSKITDAGLRRLKGMTSLRVLVLKSTQVTDAGLANLECLPELRWLDLESRNITDAGLEHLVELTRLQRLEIDSTRITDAGIRHVFRLARLQALGLSHTQITDVGLHYIETLPGLQALSLVGANITDAGIRRLQRFEKLKHLCLDSTRVTDAGLRYLEPLNQLEDLSLASDRIGDEGLEHLRGLTRLRFLQLSNTNVTDKGLEDLSGLKALVSLGIDHARVTDAGLKKLRKALPDCNVQHRTDRR